jgi:hypothetical protein
VDRPARFASCESWCAAKLTALRTSAKAQVHAVTVKLGILPPLW